MVGRLVLVTAALVAAVTTFGATATAASAAEPSRATTAQPTATTTASGHDVSYPQCGESLPDAGDIAVVGVNAGTGTTTNPCLVAQLAWGDRLTADGRIERADVYVNTANPGHLGDWWPTADLTREGVPVSNPAGTCAGAEDAACSFVYGYSIATEDMTARGVTAAADRTWWLDVETMNSWSWDRQANLAAVEGMAAAIRAGGGDVGVYSTQQQWKLIVGDATPSLALAGAPSWIAGATSRPAALANCAAGSLTPAGRVRMVQWVQQGLDHDIACGVGVSGTRPTIDGTAQVDGRLVVATGAWGPSGVGVRYVWTRNGTPIAGATAPAYSPTAEDVGTQVAVEVTGSRLGAPSLTLASAAVAVIGPDPGKVIVDPFHAQRFEP